MSCGVGHRRSSDPMLLWLWSRLVATALIGPLAWEPPYVTGAALEKTKKRKKKRKKEMGSCDMCSFVSGFLCSIQLGLGFIHRRVALKMCTAQGLAWSQMLGPHCQILEGRAESVPHGSVTT